MISTNKNIIDAVVNFTDKNLSKEAKDYFYSRKWNDSTISQWRLGFFPSGKNSELFAEVYNMKLNKQELINFKIMNLRERSFFFDRVIFPIHNSHGELIAITGRVIKDVWDKSLFGPKYYNSAYDKGNNLFGLNFAIDTIRKSDIVYVFEGNADVITAHMLGIKNVVGCQGTSFTKEHYALLSRYTKNIVLIFDNDIGGTKALGSFNKRSKDIFSKDISFVLNVSSKEVNIFIARLEDAKDPDEYLLKFGKDKFLKLIESQISNNKIQNNYRKITPPKVVNKNAKKRDV